MWIQIRPLLWEQSDLGLHYLLKCFQNISAVHKMASFVVFDLFDLILYVPSTIFQLQRDGSSWIEPALS